MKMCHACKASLKKMLDTTGCERSSLCTLFEAKRRHHVACQSFLKYNRWYIVYLSRQGVIY